MEFRKRSIEITIISLIVLVLIIFFGLKPVLKSLRETNLKLAVKKYEFSQKEEKLGSLKRIQNRIDTLKADLEMMQKALPKGEDMPALLVQIEALVSQSGLVLSSLTPSTERTAVSTQTEEGIEAAGAETVTISSVPLSLSITGSYSSLFTFLENIEKNLRPISLQSINLTAGTDEKPLSVSLNLVSFYQK